MNADAKRRGGLTALEFAALIVVILVVAALVVFPMLASRHRGNGRRSTCQDNLRQCALALQLYWADYNGCLPSSALVRHSKTWNRPDFLVFATKIGHRPPGSRPRRTWGELLYDKLGRYKEMVFCLSDPVDQANPNAQCSYWWKTAIDKAWYGVGCTRPCRREADFVWISDQVILHEREGWHFGQICGLRNDVRINVAYLDTHVRSVTIQNATSGDPVNCAANSDGEPMYFNFDNKKPNCKGNPPAAGVPARYTDPQRYSDWLPGG